MRILAIDPGPTVSGVVLYDACAGRIAWAEVVDTDALPALVARWTDPVLPGVPATVAIEMIASYGMPVGAEVFLTCIWIGRLMQSAQDPDAVRLVTRQQVKLAVCKSPRAKDANIRQALLDRIGPQGTKKSPGPTYGVKSHAWAALAVAVTVGDELMAQRRAA